MSVTYNSVNAVPSPSLPFKVATLDVKHSIKCPIVILLGIACGLIIISG